MAFPLALIPLILGAVGGAATNEEDRLEGALTGGLLGAITGGVAGGLGGAAAAEGGKAVVAETAKSALTEGVKSAAATEGGKALAASAVNEGASQAGQSALIESLVGETSSELGTEALQSQVQQNLAANLATEQAAAQAPIQTQTLAQRFGQGIKDNPQALAALAPEEEEPAPQFIQPAPLVQPQRDPVLSIEERLAMSTGDEPTFVPKGLFDETLVGMTEEEKRRKLMQQELQQRGLA